MRLAQWALLLILLGGGYAQIFSYLHQKLDESRDLRALPAAAAVSLAVYSCIMGAILLSLRDGSPAFLLFAVLFFLMLLTLAIAVARMIQYQGRMRRRWLAGMLAFGAFLLAVTVIGRTERAGTEILMHPFHSVSYAMEYHSMTSIIHMSLNALLFLPFGFLLGGVMPGVSDRFLANVSFGMMLSTAIETLQLVFQRGQCDIDDIIANTIGTALGLLAFRIWEHRHGKSTWRESLS